MRNEEEYLFYFTLFYFKSIGQDFQSVKMSSSTSTSDPRRIQNVHKVSIVADPKDTNNQDLTPDYMALLSMLCGMAGLLLKIQPISLLSLLFCVVSLANLKSENMEIKAVFSSVSIAVMAIVMSYREDIARLRAIA